MPGNRARLTTRTALLLLAGGLAFAMLPAPAFLAEGEAPAEPPATTRIRYADYLKSQAGLPMPELDLVVPAAEPAAVDGASVTTIADYEGRGPVLYWDNQEGSVRYEVQVPETGLYAISLSYYPAPGRGGTLEYALSINGTEPFEEAGRLSFQRVWKDAGPILRDNRGNDLRPSQADDPQWIEAPCRDKDGIESAPFLFRLEAGTNAIALRCVREIAYLEHLRIHSLPRRPSYAAYRDSLPEAGPVPSGFELRIQGEAAVRKSDASLYPITDRVSPLTEPYDPAKIRLNTIGGYPWRFPGQWIEWEFEVPAEGDYEIGLRFRQDQLRGLYTHRRLLVDGAVLFEEADAIRFPFDPDWKAQPLGGDAPWRIRLEAGRHVLRLETVVGTMGATIRAVESSIYDLNVLYRKIIRITGVTPDIYRDYDLPDEIPGLLSEFRRIAKVLSDELIRLERTTGRIPSEAALLREISLQLESLAKFPDTIPERLERYKSNVGSLSAWMLRMREQPLEIDWIRVSAPGIPMPRARENLGERLVHGIRSFVASFFENYDLIGNEAVGQRVLTVWVGSGRDQAQVVKTMVDDLFTPDTGIGVNVSLVQGTLLEATMAGKGPDIALGVARYLPVDMAVRGALLALDGFDGFAEAAASFQETAFVPYTFRDRVYAMPETQEFGMLFTRMDILEELGLEPPDTWEDLYRMIPILARRNMDVGIPSLLPQAPGDPYMPFPRTFGTLLIQAGLDYYNGDLSATSFDRTEAIDAFVRYVQLYRDYGLPVYYDFANRFRTGEMPVGIASYTTFNFLAIFAPEIRNLWEMRPIPGVLRPDGTVDRGEEGYGSACVAFGKVADPEAAFSFLRWWTGAEAQARFGREMESLMGPAARHPTANLAAFEQMPWSAEEARRLTAQRAQLREQPEIPGSYFVSRNLTNAVVETVFEGRNILETLEKYNKYINEEIRRKRLEFGME